MMKNIKRLQAFVSIVSLVLGVVVGLCVSVLHTNKGGLERSTWPAVAEVFYSLIGSSIIVGQLIHANATRIWTIFVASCITSYHMALAVKKL